MMHLIFKHFFHMAKSIDTVYKFSPPHPTPKINTWIFSKWIQQRKGGKPESNATISPGNLNLPACFKLY